MPYRTPRASAPRSILRTSMCVTQLTIWRLIKNFTAQIWKLFTIGTLTHHQSCLQASTTWLRTLWKGKGRLQSFCLKSQWQIFFSHKKYFLDEVYFGTGQGKSLDRTTLNYPKQYLQQLSTSMVGIFYWVLSLYLHSMLMISSRGENKYLPYFIYGATKLKRG